MPNSASLEIAVVRADERQFILPELIHLLQDMVAGGASVGFLPPLNNEDAQSYWNEIFQDIARDIQVLLVAREVGQIVGSVQLALATKPNARHRVEIQKLFVLQTQRRRGTGRALMQEIEHTARKHGRTLLVLDTRQGDVAEKLYRQLGYIEAGIIPAYARSATGELDGSIFFYKLL